MRDHTLVGLDTETTALTPDGLMIQIAIATMDNEVFVRDISYTLKDLAAARVEPTALKVNGFTLDRITGVQVDEGNGLVFNRRTLLSVQDDVMSWLAKMFTARGDLRPVDDIFKKHFIAVGWNVEAFDLDKFIRPDMPRLGAWFHHRSVDLNSLCLGMADAWGEDYEELKDLIKAHGDHMMDEFGFDEGRHDAGYDALAAVQEYHLICELLRKGVRHLGTLQAKD